MNPFPKHFRTMVCLQVEETNESYKCLPFHAFVEILEELFVCK